MSLQRKFVVLLAVLSLAVLVNAGVALWTLRFTANLATPWTSMQRIQRSLRTIKHRASDQIRLWAPYFPIAPPDEAPPPAEAPEQQFEEASADIDRALTELQAMGTYRLFIGASTSQNLERRIQSARHAGKRCLADPAPTNLDEAFDEYFNLHELIQRMEDAVLEAGSLHLDLSRVIQPWMVIILGASLLDAALAGVLGVVLVRRWVVRPVKALREATERLAQGDFAYRVPVMAKDELGKLSEEVNHMAGMISAMQEERVERERLAAVGEMVRRLAHNLRNPLAGIRSLAELTRTELPPDAPGQENQARIVATVDRFEHWLKDVLNATSPLQISRQSIPVGPWIQAVLEPLRAMGAAKGVDLVLDADRAPAVADLDPRHLEHAVVAVVTNAIQASPHAQGVSVAVRTCEDGQSWEIRVADRGPGVPPDVVDRIFRPYFTTKRDGTGIGLAVAKQVVEQHGGRIWVESGGTGREEGVTGGSGAVFTMRMPRSTEATNGGQARSGQDGADSGQGAGSRGRGEPQILNPADAPAGRA